MTDSIIFKDRYVVEKEISRNYHSITCIVYDPILGRKYVLKRMTVGLAGSLEVVEQFESEAAVLSNLDHPGLPKILDVFSDGAGGDRTINFVREYIRARDLGDLVRSGRYFTETEIIEYLLEFTSILEYLHGFSPPILHRNIKPGNILIDEDGHAYAIDFGFTKRPNSQPVLIREQVVEESAGYIPPEMLLNQATPASDICALGLSMIYALSHTEPILMEKKNGRPDFRRHVNISEKFARILNRMIDPEWKNRYRSAAALRKDLKKIIVSRKSQKPSPETTGKPDAAFLDKKVTAVKSFFNGIRANSNKRIVALILSIMAVLIVVALVQKPRNVYISSPSVNRNDTAVEISGITLTTDKQLYAPDEPIVVSLTGLAGNEKDWLTVVNSTTPDTSYAQWFYTQGVKEGNFTFKGLPAGKYEVRLYFNWPAGGYQVQKRRAFTVAKSAPSEPEYRTVNQKIRIFADGMPVQKVTSVKPEIKIRSKDLNMRLSPIMKDLGELYEIQGIPTGTNELNVKVNANLANPEIFPGDYYSENLNMETTGDDAIAHVHLVQILHMLSPQDNRETMSHNGSSTCSDPMELKSPVEFVWEPLEGDILYEYEVGMTDCIRNIAGIENQIMGRTLDTRITLDLPPTPGEKDRKYTFHLMAWKGDTQVGRLYVHDQGGGNWNYGFRVVP